jgi:hypothetical protein
MQQTKHCRLLLSGFFLGLLFGPEHGGDMLLRSIGFLEVLSATTQTTALTINMHILDHVTSGGWVIFTKSVTVLT